MNQISRYITPFVQEDLKSKMVFIGGPRQVGKTTLALSNLSKGSQTHAAYLNWDNVKKRSALLKGELPQNQPLVILDEIHKYAQWRNLVKGFYDTYKNDIQFLVTGSARLDYYRKGGDSLQGRYFYYRLHPLSLMELNPNPTKPDLESLLKFGGFPEPFLRGKERFWRRWQRERLQKVIYDDIRDLEHVREISLMELLAAELPHRVGAPLSIRNLSILLEIAPKTCKKWVSIFDQMYYSFRISPYGSPKIRAVKKEQKIYLWDWSIIKEKGYKFENLVACQLLKYCHFIEDTEGYNMELRFIRDTDKREVDFVVLKDKKPIFAVEAKTGEKGLSPAIPYFNDRTEIPKFYQVHLGEKDVLKDGFRILPFTTFCKELGMP
ncbi:MAG: ATP-binding protein [Candidatus Marinimicrobia bacterium]|nr:ATP-binding protein [Candidatus Neomarinimicrobiota bacterium]